VCARELAAEHQLEGAYSSSLRAHREGMSRWRREQRSSLRPRRQEAEGHVASFRTHIEQRSRLRARIEEQLKTAWTRSSSLRPHTLAA
jgi:hypothetical protein